MESADTGDLKSPAVRRVGSSPTTPTRERKWMKTASNSNLLSIFWYIDGEFIGIDEELRGEMVEQFGDYLQIDDDHYNIWFDTIVLVYPELSGYEYDDFPRGRIMFDTRLHKFKVVGDEKICNDPTVQEKVRKNYGLPITTVFDTDEHYQSRY